MKLPLLSGLLALVLAVPAFAQTSPTPAAQEPASPSLLGKRYIEASAGIVASSPDDGYGLGAAFNAPLTAGLDVGASFQHNWLEGDSSDNYQDLAVNLTGYQDLGKIRVFGRATLGYEWWSVADESWYQFEAGAEYALTSRLLVSAQVAWYDYFSSDTSDGAFAGGPKVTYWTSSAIALSGSAILQEGGDVAYVLGVAFVF